MRRVVSCHYRDYDENYCSFQYSDVPLFAQTCSSSPAPKWICQRLNNIHATQTLKTASFSTSVSMAKFPGETAANWDKCLMIRTRDATGLGMYLNGKCKYVITIYIPRYVMGLIGDDIRAIRRNADVLLNACKETGLAVNIGKTEYKEVGSHWGMMVNEYMTVDSNSYKKVKINI